MTLYPVVKQDDGSWTASLEVLLYIWNQMKKEGKDKTVFQAGTVQNEIDFIRHMTSPEVYPLIVEHNNDVIGIAWLTGVNKRFGSAMPHFCSFRNGDNYTYQEVIDGGKLVLEFWKSLTDLKILVGHIPAKNKQAIRFSEALGMTRSGEVPGMLAGMDGNRNDAVIYYMNMEN
jgi:hypothetical protein